MKYINVFQTEAEFNNVSNGLMRPQLSLVENKIYCQSAPTIEYVDLGLSVKWAKYNFGATGGDTSTSWFGNYYYYPQCKNVIASTYGGNCRMPTKTELDALIALPNEWVTNYNDITGLNGRTFTGNGNTLFIPAAGYTFGSSNYYKGRECGLWTSSLQSEGSENVWCLYFSSSEIAAKCYPTNEYIGFPIHVVS